MTILAIDTATKAIGLALYDGSMVLAESVWNSHNYHTVELAPAVQKLLNQAQIDSEDLQAIAISIGPGSYTGLRIGLAFAKGYSFPGRLPLIPIPTLDVIASAQSLSTYPLAAVLQAGRERLAVAWYENKDEAWSLAKEKELMTVDELAEAIRKPTIIAGELTAKQRARLQRKRKNIRLASPAQSMRRPSILAEMAWRRWNEGKEEYEAGLGPEYLQTNQDIPS